MKAIVNATPLIALARIGRLDLLQQSRKTRLRFWAHLVERGYDAITPKRNRAKTLSNRLMECMPRQAPTKG